VAASVVGIHKRRNVVVVVFITAVVIIRNMAIQGTRSATCTETLNLMLRVVVVARTGWSSYR
jgi:hypothetical protein